MPLALGLLELSHPTWTDGSVAQGVAAAGHWWIPLHVALIVGYATLGWTLWPAARSARLLLAVFLVCNTAFLAIDGLAVGLVAESNPPAADALWNSEPVEVLANLTGATWAGALLWTAAQSRGIHDRGSATTRLRVACGLCWLAFVASAWLPVAGVASRALALATGAGVVYASGARGLPRALLVFAAVLPQHAGGEASLGMLCLALAAASRLVTGRSSPVASSRPGSG